MGGGGGYYKGDHKSGAIGKYIDFVAVRQHPPSLKEINYKQLKEGDEGG